MKHSVCWKHEAIKWLDDVYAQMLPLVSPHIYSFGHSPFVKIKTSHVHPFSAMEVIFWLSDASYCLQVNKNIIATDKFACAYRCIGSGKLCNLSNYCNGDTLAGLFSNYA